MPTATHATPLLTWVVGAVAILIHAHKKPKPRLKRGGSNKPKEEEEEGGDKTVGSGRRSRFQDAQLAPIYCMPDAKAYEAAIAEMAIDRQSTVVLEIGCQLNSVTQHLAERAHAVVGIDINRKAPNSQRATPSQSAFYLRPDTPLPARTTLHIIDVWNLNALAGIVDGSRAVTGGKQIGVAFIDATIVLGNDLPIEALSLARTIGRLCPHLQCLVVKSRALCSLQQHLRPAPCPSRPLRRPSAASSQSFATAAHGSVHIVAADLVHDYRTAALDCVEHLLQPGESALEIGAHVGASTVIIHDALRSAGGGSCLGVDVSDAIIRRAKALNPHVPFDVADAWDVGSLLRALENQSVNAPALLLVDVGGLSGANGTLDALTLIRVLCAVFHRTLRALVIKSSCMRTLARQLKNARELRLP